MLLFHMSPQVYADGQTVPGNGRVKVTPSIDAIFERTRTGVSLPREKYVFCLDHTDYSVCGVTEPGFIYTVECNTPAARLDYSWVGILQLDAVREKHKNLLDRWITNPFPKLSDQEAEECAKKYWAMESTNQPCWEYLCESVIVKSRLSSTLVDPKTTNGGWTP